MRDVNKVILIGRLGKDPVLVETRNGLTCVKFTLATSYRSKANAEGGEFKEETQWHRVVVFGRQAETCLQYLKKGAPAFIDGTFRSSDFEGKDGTKRTSYEVIADNVVFLGAPKRSTESVASEPVATTA